jgi:putative transposase
MAASILLANIYRCGQYIGVQSISMASNLRFLLQKRRDKAAVKRFFKCVLAAYPEVPRKIVTDQLRNSLPIPAAKAENPERENVKHASVLIELRTDPAALRSEARSAQARRHDRGNASRVECRFSIENRGSGWQRIRKHALRHCASA